ncbi:MAG: ester cyclase [Ktedonobacteraceae bacterium]
MSNTEIVKTGLQAWESNDIQTMTELVADDFVLRGPTPEPLGKPEFIGLMQILHAGTPDFAFNVSSYEEHDDTVVAKAHITATHTGVLAFPGMPPIPATGKKVSLPEEVQTYTLKNGKLASLTTDGKPDAGIPGMLAQLGIPTSQG